MTFAVLMSACLDIASCRKCRDSIHLYVGVSQHENPLIAISSSGSFRSIYPFSVRRDHNETARSCSLSTGDPVGSVAARDGHSIPSTGAAGD
jgi:hypothetical protein